MHLVRNAFFGECRARDLRFAMPSGQPWSLPRFPGPSFASLTDYRAGICAAPEAAGAGAAAEAGAAADGADVPGIWAAPEAAGAAGALCCARSRMLPDDAGARRLPKYASAS